MLAGAGGGGWRVWCYVLAAVAGALGCGDVLVGYCAAVMAAVLADVR